MIEIQDVVVEAEAYKLAADKADKYRQRLENILFEAVKRGITLYGVQKRTGIIEATLRAMIKRVEKSRKEAADSICSDGVQELSQAKSPILYLPGGYILEVASIIDEEGINYHLIVGKRQAPLMVNPTRYDYVFSTENEWDLPVFDRLFGTRQAWEKPLDKIRQDLGNLDLAQELAEEEIDSELDW